MLLLPFLLQPNYLVFKKIDFKGQIQCRDASDIGQTSREMGAPKHEKNEEMLAGIHWVISSRCGNNLCRYKDAHDIHSILRFLRDRGGWVVEGGETI